MSLWGHGEIDAVEMTRRAEAIRAMANSEPFRWLMEAAIESAHRDWETGKTVEQREEAFARMTGIRAVDTEIQKVVDRGAAAAKTLRGREQQQSNNNP
jgi:hypothetical protein